MAYVHQRDSHLDATVERITKLNPDTLCIRLSCPTLEDYKAGQYLRIWIDEHRVRSYSLASAPSIDGDLQLHVRRNANSEVSRWFHEVLQVGDKLRIDRPRGSSCYIPSRFDQPMLMIGTGSGLAPLYGMAREALRHGHRGDIHLYHGVRYREDLYLAEQLRALSSLNRNFRYTPCISRGYAADDCMSGRALDVAMRDIPLSAEWLVYLSGNPHMVRDAAKAAVAFGVPAEAILSDALAPGESPILAARAA